MKYVLNSTLKKIQWKKLKKKINQKTFPNQLKTNYIVN